MNDWRSGERGSGISALPARHDDDDDDDDDLYNSHIIAMASESKNNYVKTKKTGI